MSTSEGCLSGDRGKRQAVYSGHPCCCFLSSQSQVWEASVGLHTAPRREQIGDSWSEMTSCRLRLLKLQLFFKTDGVKRLPHLDRLRGKLCSALETDFQKCSHSAQCPLKPTKLSCFQDGREGSTLLVSASQHRPKLRMGKERAC